MGIFKAAGQFIKGQYKENVETIFHLIQGWKFFMETEVVVGIPEETNTGREHGMTNSSLLYLHEQGVPSHNIPPRPVLEPAIGQDDVKEKIEILMREAIEAALVEGDVEKAKENYEKAGMIGRDACKDYILSGALAPNAPSTIAKKGSSTPLVDTGSMLGSISYAVRRKK